MLTALRSTLTLLGIAATVAATAIVCSKPAAAQTRPIASPNLRAAVVGNRAPKALTTWSQPGSLPLNHPWGMAIDAAGNLWVANQGANAILKYDSSLVQHPGHTIRTNVSQPNAVAFDSHGDLYVANGGTNSITEYNPSTLAQIPRTLTAMISNPKWIAIDGVDDIWVNNGFQTITAYASDESFLKTVPIGQPGGIAVKGGYLAIGSGTSLFYLDLQQELVSNLQLGTGYPISIIGSCFDANGNAYYTDAATGDILFVNSASRSLSVFSSTLFASTSAAPFSPDGIAADIAHDHIFVSSYSTNQIAVYRTNGALLTVIE